MASKLALHGLVPMFPGVDHGYDIGLENGIRIQVKSSKLKFHLSYPEGTYCFDCRKFNWSSPEQRVRATRRYQFKADFFAFWGIDENRFWIIPTAETKTCIWVPREADYKKPIKWQTFENRWDLLDVESTARSLVQAVEISS